MEELEKTLHQFCQLGLIDKILTFDDLYNLSHQKEEIPIMMGQTFDGGQPADMIKYALVIMELEDGLKRSGAVPSSQWLLADHFMTSINKEKEQAESLSQRRSRQEFLEKINQAYKGDIKIIYSSDLINQERYIKTLEDLQEQLEKKSGFKEEMLASIPQDRRQNPEAIRYPLEELATIFSLGTKIKVGPRYEANYDIPARNVAEGLGFNRYVAIHITNAFPFGAPTIPKEDQVEIENVGLTPYKINSKKMGQYRLDPINGKSSEDEKLLLQTRDFRAIKDLVSFSLLARKRLTGNENFGELEYLHDSEDARIVAYELYNKYIKQPISK
jgi:hypothetical protein